VQLDRGQDTIEPEMSAASWRRLGARALIAAFTAATTSAPARADDTGRAKTLFADGVRLYRNGDWEGARRLFREADAAHHAPTIIYNVGLAEEKLGHPQAAVDCYEQYIAESGEHGEFAVPAAAAIAQIKARSTRLRVETRPPGARVFVNGKALDEPAPTTLLVPAGHHVVVAEGDGWREERTLEVRGAGDIENVVFHRDAPDAAPSAAEPPPPASPPAIGLAPAPQADREHPAPPSSAQPTENKPDAVVWGAAFAMVPMYLMGVDKPGARNANPAHSFIAGPQLEAGYALTSDFEFLLRGLAGLGPDGKPSWGYVLGPGLSVRATRWCWLGATFIGGDIETAAKTVPYQTDLVFGTMLEASVVVLRRPEGEWLVSTQPSLLLARNYENNTALFLPVSFGFRAY
jgi:hypothetical protein